MFVLNQKGLDRQWIGLSTPEACANPTFSIKLNEFSGFSSIPSGLYSNTSILQNYCKTISLELARNLYRKCIAFGQVVPSGWVMGWLYNSEKKLSATI